MRRHDGEYRWFLFRANPLRDEAGDVAKWYGVNTDIEDRKRAEAELRRAYDSFADAQRLSKTGSFITDLVGDDHNWSDEALRIFEFDPATKVTLQAHSRRHSSGGHAGVRSGVRTRRVTGWMSVWPTASSPPAGSEAFRGVAHVSKK